MVYSPPSFATLRTAVQRDLRDPTGKTFTTEQTTDLITAGIVEVSSVCPMEGIESVPFVADTADYPIGLTEVFKVELFVDGRFHTTLRPNTDDDVGSQGGWDFFAGSIHIPWSIVPRLSVDTSDTFSVWGYRPRDVLTEDTDILEGGAVIEQAVRTYAVLEGYQRLINQRGLFQQWAETPGNTDVSPTQLMGFAQTFESQWQRIRQQVRLLRRR